MAVTIKDIVFWDMMLCGSSKKNWHFRGTYWLHLQGNKILSSPNSQQGRASRQMAKRAFYSNTLVPFTRATWHHIPDNILNFCCHAKLFQKAAFFNLILYSCMGMLIKTYSMKQQPINNSSTVMNWHNCGAAIARGSLCHQSWVA
jgi:hypothetical protein